MIGLFFFGGCPQEIASSFCHCEGAADAFSACLPHVILSGAAGAFTAAKRRISLLRIFCFYSYLSGNMVNTPPLLIQSRENLFADEPRQAFQRSIKQRCIEDCRDGAKILCDPGHTRKFVFNFVYEIVFSIVEKKPARVNHEICHKQASLINHTAGLPLGILND